MLIAFRVDASSQIGTGHVMRCLTLADGLAMQGASVRFLARHMPLYLQEIIISKGFEFKLLSSKSNGKYINELRHAEWLGIPQDNDAEETIATLTDKKWDWLIVDHYALDARWESVMRHATKHIMVIDDIADRKHDCDVLLDQNFYADMQTRYVDKVPAHCQLLLGPNYALLRDEFRKLREQLQPRTGSVKRILVFFGGVDTDNYTGLAIQALAELSNKELNVDVVIGAQHPCRAEIETNCAAQGFVCHVQTDRMAELMAAADLAIGAGGSATWERCCLGLPALSIYIASNQQKQIADAAEAGLLYAPLINDDLADVFKRHTLALFENAPLLRLISNAAMKAADGKGLIRVINFLKLNGIEILLAGEMDSQKLFEWRNHPTIRAVSTSSELFSWESHQAWFASVLVDNDRVLLIGYIENEPVGVVRFDKEGDSAKVSIYLVPEGGFKGQGKNLLLSAEQWIRENRSDIRHVQAVVLGDNKRSKQLFSGADYCLEATCYRKKL